MEQRDIVISMLEICGFIPSPTRNPGNNNVVCSRRQLVQGVDKLMDAIHYWENCRTERFTEYDALIFMQLETILRELRDEMTNYITVILQDRTEMIALVQNLESRDAGTTLVTVARSLCLAHAIQTQKEESCAKETLKFLDVIYSMGDNMTEASQGQLAALKATLGRHDLLETSIFAEFAQVVRRQDMGSDSCPPPEYNTSNQFILNSETRDCFAAAKPGESFVNATDIWEKIKQYLHHNDPKDGSAALFTSILFVGPEGYGKTHLCDKISGMAKEFCPGSGVGDMEDFLVSVFTSIREQQGNIVLLLDDIDHILNSDSTPSRPEIGRDLRRSEAIFLSLLDSLKRYSQPGSSVLLIGTSDKDIVTGRFDHVVRLEPPNELERKGLITSLLIPNDPLPSDKDVVLDALVDATNGTTYAELVQHCRLALEQCNIDDPPLVVLHTLKERVGSARPESLKSGVLMDAVDLQVFTARDLVDFPKYEFAMKGCSAAAAWHEMKTNIIIPLCQWKELRQILPHNDNVLRGGVLVTGPPGCGKTELALQCAKYAASLLPALRVLCVPCTSLIHKELGGSERAVQRLFSCARQATPCLLILDGIENIASVRGNDTTTEGTFDRVLSTLLLELDGVDNLGGPGGIGVIGITHDALWIDPALRRPGRLQKTLVLKKDWVD